MVDFDDTKEIFLTQIEYKGYKYVIDKQTRLGGKDQIELWSLVKGRVPIKIRKARGWFYLAASIVADNFNITEQNCRQKAQEALSDNEIIVDWTLGHWYYKKGNKIKRCQLDNYKIIEKPLFFYPKQEVDDYEIGIL
jgi:hypothetical protein